MPQSPVMHADSTVPKRRKTSKSAVNAKWRAWNGASSEKYHWASADSRLYPLTTMDQKSGPSVEQWRRQAEEKTAEYFCSAVGRLCGRGVGREDRGQGCLRSERWMIVGPGAAGE